MARRPKQKRTPRLETLETRMVLSGMSPSNDAQYVLELVNLARTKPAEAADRLMSNLESDVQATLSFYGVDAGAERQAVASMAPRAPLAWSGELATAAQAQSQDMADKNFQSHVGSDGSTLEQRVDRAGYTDRVSAAENAFAYAKSTKNAMQAFLFDWGVEGKWHRRTLMEPDTAASQQYTEVGIGVVDKSTPVVPRKVVTQVLGRRANAKAQIVGVVYDDRDGDKFYTPGEGEGNVSIDVTNVETGEAQAVQTWSSGGYQLPVSPGRYQVTAKVPGRGATIQNVTVGGQNVKVDFVAGQTASVPKAVVSPAKPATVRVAPVETISTTLTTPAPARTSLPPAPTTVTITKAENVDRSAALAAVVAETEANVVAELERVRGNTTSSTPAAAAQVEAPAPMAPTTVSVAFSEKVGTSKALSASAVDKLFSVARGWTYWRVGSGAV